MATGFNLIMNFDTSTHFNPAHRQCDFDREVGKVRAFLFSSKFLFFLTSASHCFQFQWGAARQLEPLPGYSASNINKNIGEFQSPGFPSSVRLHTSPSPSRVQLLSAANTAFSHNCPAPQVPSVQSPPLSPSPSPHPTPASLAPNYC